MARQIRGIPYSEAHKRVVDQYGSKGVRFWDSKSRRAMNARLDQAAQQIVSERQQNQQVQQLQQEVAQERQALEELKITRRRTNRSALQPSSNLFSLLGGSQNGRSTLG